MKRSRENGYFMPTHRFVEKHARVLGPHATLVYIALLSHAQGKRFAFPSQRLLAEELDISTRSVIRALQKLEQVGDIWVDKKTSGRSNEYHLRDRGWYEPMVTRSHYMRDSKSPQLMTGRHPNNKQVNKEEYKDILIIESIKNLAKEKRVPP